jgi:hypothetical protein
MALRSSNWNTDELQQAMKMSQHAFPIERPTEQFTFSIYLIESSVHGCGKKY